MKIRAFMPSDEQAVIDLWRSCGLVAPQNIPRTDMEKKLEVAPELFFVGTLDVEIVATVMAGYERHRGWINYLAVAPRLQRTGDGRQMMENAAMLLRERGCPKINLQILSAKKKVIEFDQRLGFSFDDVLSMGKRLATDEPFTP